MNNFNMVTSDWTKIIGAFDAISNLVEECKIELESEGITLTTIDKGHVTFVSLYFPELEFDIYKCEQPKTICLDADELIKILQLGEKDDVMSWTIDESTLFIKFEGDVNKKFSLQLIDEIYEVPRTPEIDNPISINIPSGLFKKCITTIEKFSNKTKLRANPDNLFLESFADFGQDCTLEYLHGELIKDEYVSVYATEMLKKITRADKFSPSLQLQFGNDMPLILTFEDMGSKLQFIVAPRLEDDE